MVYMNSKVKIPLQVPEASYISNSVAPQDEYSGNSVEPEDAYSGSSVEPGDGYSGNGVASEEQVLDTFFQTKESGINNVCLQSRSFRARRYYIPSYSISYLKCLVLQLSTL
jgi:hypothetical protein